jgi:hypothetical protein
VLAQQLGRVGVNKQQPVAGLNFAVCSSSSFPPSWSTGRFTVSTAPVRSSPVSGSRYGISRSAQDQRKPHSSARRQPLRIITR